MDSKHLHQLHLVMVPLMAQGHMLPMIDMARLFAARGLFITIVTTTESASRLRPTIDRAAESGLQIHLLPLHFPCQEVGLPDGCDSLDTLNSTEMVRNFFRGIDLLRHPVEQFLQEHHLHPSCIITDMGIAWTKETALKFSIPRLVFHGTCCFSLLCSYNFHEYKLHESTVSETEPIVIPNLPNRVEVTKAQLPGIFSGSSDIKDIHEKIREAERAADGVVVNSFYELETEYVENYQKAKGKKTWPIGPVSLCNRETADKTQRGKEASVSENDCLTWLDSRKPNSVIYVCFGSLCRLPLPQLIQIGLGLEASEKPFIWVIKNSDSEMEKWLADGFEERVKERSIVIRGWAPQIVILSHLSTGGFLTHCGWNSTLEAICYGVPMVTWPLFAEQFLNEKLVIHVLQTGVSAGAKIGGIWWKEGSAENLVMMDDVRRAVEMVMDEGGEGEERRKRAREFGEKARCALEVGGSSYNNMTHLIEYILHLTSQGRCFNDGVYQETGIGGNVEGDENLKNRSNLEFKSRYHHRPMNSVTQIPRYGSYGSTQKG